MSKITSYDSIRMTKVIICLLLIIVFYTVHIFSDTINREEVENYIIMQMVEDNEKDIIKLKSELKTRNAYDICNNEYVNAHNYEVFKYCISHKR